ncbi:MAG: HAD family hydrolase [Planctomycetota bacterium]
MSKYRSRVFSSYHGHRHSPVEVQSGSYVISPEKFNLDEELGLNKKKKSKRSGLDQIKPKPGQRKPAPGEANRTADQRIRARRVDLVAIDLDGTLLTSDKRLSVKAIEAVTEIRKRGIKVVIATARPPRTVREIYDHLKLNTHQINYNGALIQHPDHATPLRHEPITPDLAYAICTVARKTDNRCIIALEILDKWYTDKHDPTLVTETSKKFKPDYVGPLLEPLKQPITKLMVMAPPERMAIIRKVLLDRYNKATTMVVNEEHLTQIASYQADKGRALHYLCEKYKIDPQHTLAIGDGPNDVGMLKFAGLGIAMGNAFPEAKEAADLVAPSNDDEGVAHVLWKYIA